MAKPQFPGQSDTPAIDAEDGRIDTAIENFDESTEPHNVTQDGLPSSGTTPPEDLTSNESHNSITSESVSPEFDRAQADQQTARTASQANEIAKFTQHDPDTKETLNVWSNEINQFMTRQDQINKDIPSASPRSDHETMGSSGKPKGRMTRATSQAAATKARSEKPVPTKSDRVQPDRGYGVKKKSTAVKRKKARSVTSSSEAEYESHDDSEDYAPPAMKKPRGARNKTGTADVSKPTVKEGQLIAGQEEGRERAPTGNGKVNTIHGAFRTSGR